MKRIFYSLFVYVLFFACKAPSDQEIIQSRWNFSGTDIRPLEKIATQYQTTYGVNGFKQVFAASKFILRKDQTFDLCLFQNYRHGRWKERNGSLVLLIEPMNDSLVFNIDTLGAGYMQLSIDSNNFKQLGRFVMPYENIAFFERKNRARFRFEPDKDEYHNLAKDPYSRENNWWRIQPTKPESYEQLHKRARKLVDFHLLMFEDAIENEKKVITYNWFSSPIIVANNGLALKNYKKIEADWKEYFYDSAQARQGFQILSAGFDKKMNFPHEIKDPFKRSLNMLQQYRSNLQ
jgi:hypothetical protein